ncbi:hypothetical protein CQW23_30530 [Capsicum baccatum]|uniref:Uncharacterized protein n=1 Tax=Capsicum baccatum TaxID=33114 RepID=A0A2G2VA51_CAPBA|nr:hypothetical protein CQW23_30530 [Capsicum baccatum]
MAGLAHSINDDPNRVILIPRSRKTGKAKDSFSGEKPTPGGQVGERVKGSGEGPSKWSMIGSGNAVGQQTIVKLRYIPHCRKQCSIRESKESRDNLMAFRDIVQLSLGTTNMKDVKYFPLESENFVPCFNVSKNLNLGLSKGDEVYRLMMLEEEQLCFRSDSAMFDNS